MEAEEWVAFVGSNEPLASLIGGAAVNDIPGGFLRRVIVGHCIDNVLVPKNCQATRNVERVPYTEDDIVFREEERMYVCGAGIGEGCEDGGFARCG